MLSQLQIYIRLDVLWYVSLRIIDLPIKAAVVPVLWLAMIDRPGYQPVR